MEKWHYCIACLDATTGESVDYENIIRMKKIIYTWLTSQKAIDAAFAAMPKEQQKYIANLQEEYAIEKK